jgi:hypothetical protein
VFVRYSLARFLRFWLLRQLYEGQAHIDQVVAALGGRGTPVDDGARTVASPAASPAEGNSDELV